MAQAFGIHREGRRSRLIAPFLMMAMAAGASRADVRLPAVFGDHMVLALARSGGAGGAGAEARGLLETWRAEGCDAAWPLALGPAVRA